MPPAAAISPGPMFFFIDKLQVSMFSMVAMVALAHQIEIIFHPKPLVVRH